MTYFIIFSMIIYSLNNFLEETLVHNLFLCAMLTILLKYYGSFVAQDYVHTSTNWL